MKASLEKIYVPHATETIVNDVLQTCNWKKRHNTIYSKV